jgi:SAM-dependent methyltransferase
MASPAVASAFDHVAAGYDESFGTNPVGLLFRYVFQERLRTLLPPGARAVDLGCGTGEDALFLASRGVTVLGLDASASMVQRARDKASARGLAARSRFEVRRLEQLEAADGVFDGAYSNFGALNCADLVALGQALAAALRPGAPVLLSLMGRHPLPAMAERALTAHGQARGREPAQVAGLAVPVEYPTRREAQRLLGRVWRWRRGFALGVLVPDPSHAPWVERHPQAFGVLAAFEALLRGWPLLRGLGDHIVLEGVRR